VTSRAACSELVAICSSERCIGRHRMTQREFGLRAQPGERRLHLVRGVGDEALLQRHVLFEARQQSLNDVTSGSISGGARCASTGDRSSGRRARMRACSALSGASRATARTRRAGSRAAGSRTAAGSRP
jgi:hypothetical protein